MVRHRIWLGLALVAVLAAVAPREARAQAVEGGSGVVIDADGVVRMQTFQDPTGQLARQRVAEARASLDQSLAKPSKMRKVSLTRLEAAIAAGLKENRRPSDAMRYLAGLTRIQYVFFYPETGDVVVAGPAEGWCEDITGRVVGLESKRPVLLLEDMVVALRAFGPNGRAARTVGCSIDPTAEGLVKMQKFLAQVGGRATPADTQFIVKGLHESLGLQTVRVDGISPETHFAQVLVEADYRMKLIGIGLEKPPVKITTYVEKANPAGVARNALQRWYFVPNYECVRASDDRNAMEMVGEGVKLVGEDEAIGAGGERRASGKVDRASSLFTNSFTQKYPELAAREPVYAQLRNLVDMLVAAAYIQNEDFYGKADWKLATFGDESRFPVEVHNVPKHADTAVNSIWRGNRLMTPIGGGVTINAKKALDESNLLSDEEGKIETERAAIDPKTLGAGEWWWD